MDSLACIEADRKRTKRCAWIATIAYSLLLPVLFLFAVTSVLIFDSPSMPVLLGLSIIFLYFCVPLSVPVTFYFIWSQYNQENYKKSRQLCLIPVYVAIVAIIYDSLTDAIRLMF